MHLARLIYPKDLYSGLGKSQVTLTIFLFVERKIPQGTFKPA